MFHDVINLRDACKAIEQGVDGIIAVCTGAGGHAGMLSPFALIKEIRREFDGAIIPAAHDLVLRIADEYEQARGRVLAN